LYGLTCDLQNQTEPIERRHTVEEEGKNSEMQALGSAPDESPEPTMGTEPAADALSQLVRDVQATGVSFQGMADRAAKRGYSISKPYFQKIAAGNATTAPTAERLKAIAAGLGIPMRIVQRAAAIQYLNYQATELSGYDDDTRIIVAHLAGKSPADRRRWRAMIEAEDSVED
jgi:transcriptional regulator with XRE-family HTH domain